MNMNNFPSGFESATERNPLPHWLRWVAAALIFACYGALELHDHYTEQAIQQSPKGTAQQ